MVSKILKALNRQVEGLHDAAYLLAFFAIISHVLAIVRDRLFAHFFGASQSLDIYYAAFKIPDFVFITIGSLVSFFVLIPFILDRLHISKENTQQFLSSVFTAFFLSITAVSVVLYFLAPQLLEWLFADMYASESGPLLLRMTRIMFLSPIILGISNIYLSITQTKKHFFVYALSPILYNLGIIAGILFLYPVFGIPGLAYGVIFGALMHMMIQMPVVSGAGLMPKFNFSINWKEVWEVTRTSLPRTIGLSLSQIALLALVVLAARIAEGSVAIFTFSHNLQSVPLSIIGISYSVAAFPTLASYASNGELEKFHASMMAAVRHILFWSFPALVLFVVLRAQIVRTILGSGEFTWADTRLTAAVMALFVVSLAAQALVMLFVRGYYAAGKTAKPLILNAISAALIIIFAYAGLTLFEMNEVFRLFIEELLRVERLAGTSILVLALAFTLGTVINALGFWFLYRHDFGGKFPRSLYKTVLHSFSASVLAGAASYGMLQVLDDIFDLDTFIGIFGQGLFAGLVGIFVGAFVLWLFKSEELIEVWETLHHKLWKANPVRVE